MLGSAVCAQDSVFAEINVHKVRICAVKVFLNLRCIINARIVENP